MSTHHRVLDPHQVTDLLDVLIRVQQDLDQLNHSVKTLNTLKKSRMSFFNPPQPAGGDQQADVLVHAQQQIRQIRAAAEASGIVAVNASKCVV